MKENRRERDGMITVHGNGKEEILLLLDYLDLRRLELSPRDRLESMLIV